MTDKNFDSRRVYNARRKRRRRKIVLKRILCFCLFAAVIFTVILGITKGVKSFKNSGIGGILSDNEVTEQLKAVKIPEWVDVQLLHPHGTARSETAVGAIKNIVIHYVANPGSTAQNNRDYFDKEDTEVSSHFVVGLDGEIIQCLPLWEKSAASNERNRDTISIEVCHPDTSGKFNDSTYNSVIKLCAYLCKELKLDENTLIRHYDITGKLCPVYYVENGDKWEKLKKDVGTAINEQ